MNILPFMKWRLAAAIFSAIAMSIAVGSLSVQQLNWGLDFTGGTLVEVEYADSADLNVIRSTLDQSGYQGAVVVSFGTDRDVLVRLPQGFSDDEGVAMVEVLRAASPVDVELRRVEFVGPQVGDELREQGGLAMLLALGLVMLYVGFRFQFKFAVGAVVACRAIHGVVLPRFWCGSGHSADGELGIVSRIYVFIGCHSDPARYCRYRIDSGYGGGCKRADFCSY